MAKAYIANRPVRFDRNYKVGEVIPDGVISPNMGRRLTEMGRILCVDLPDTDTNATLPQGGAEPPKNSTEPARNGGEPQQGSTEPPAGGEEPPQGSAKPPTGGEGDADKVNTRGKTTDVPEGKPDGQEGKLTAAYLIDGTAGEFVCEVCGRAFQSQQGLAAHSRSHKE